MNDLTVEDMVIAPSVVETIVSIAVKDVDGVASVGSPVTSGLMSVISSRPSTQGVDVVIDADDRLHVTVHVDVCYGYVLPDVADAIRMAIDQAVESQIGAEVAEVDVYVDGLQFEN